MKKAKEVKIYFKICKEECKMFMINVDLLVAIVINRYIDI